MPEYPTPPNPNPLRKALTELLEQKVTVPDSYTGFAQEIGAQWNKEKPPYTLRINEDNSLDVEGPARTNLKNSLTMRQVLSGVAAELGDHFVLESSRDQHRKTFEYQQLIEATPELKKYLRFFDAITSIVKHNELPSDVTAAELPVLMRTGLQLIKGIANKYKEWMESHLDTGHDPKKLKDRVMLQQTMFVFFGIVPDDWVPSPLREKIDHLRMVHDTEPERTVTEDYIAEELKLAHELGHIMIDRKMFDLNTQIKKVAEEGQQSAESHEDTYAFFNKISSDVRLALKKGGIDTRSAGDNPLGH